MVACVYMNAFHELLAAIVAIITAVQSFISPVPVSRPVATGNEQSVVQTNPAPSNGADKTVAKAATNPSDVAAAPNDSDAPVKVSPAAFSALFEHCKQGSIEAVQAALDAAGIKIQVRGCAAGKDISYEGGSLHTVMISRAATGPDDDLLVPLTLIILPNGGLQRSASFASGYQLGQFLSQKLDTTWGISALKKMQYIFRNGEVCISWAAQFPLRGELADCPSGVTGDVSYDPAALTWTGANQIATQEFSKVQGSDAYDDGSSNGGISWAFKAGTVPSSSYYVFARSIRRNGLYNPVVVRVFLDGTSDSQEIEKKCGYVCKADIYRY